MEWLTGGKCKAGMKEAAVTDRTIDAINLAREQSRTLWKVASTVSHDQNLLTTYCVQYLEFF
jgi:phage terminase small subunit